MSAKERLVGTGRFTPAELRHWRDAPLANLSFVRLRCASSHSTWGASWVGPRKSVLEVQKINVRGGKIGRDGQI